MACYVGLNKYMDAAAELGRNPVSKHHIFQPEYGDEHADAGRDCRNRLARPNSQARTRTGEYLFFPVVQLTTDEEDWQPYPVDPYSCYMCDHTKARRAAGRYWISKLDVGLPPSKLLLRLTEQ